MEIFLLNHCFQTAADFITTNKGSGWTNYFKVQKLVEFLLSSYLTFEIQDKFTFVHPCGKHGTSGNTTWTGDVSSPQMAAMPPTMSATPGSTLRLPCRVLGRSRPSISWVKVLLVIHVPYPYHHRTVSPWGQEQAIGWLQTALYCSTGLAQVPRAGGRCVFLLSWTSWSGTLAQPPWAVRDGL